MTPESFIEKWRDATLTERAGAQSHFNDLCELLEVDKPAAADRHGESYTFEKSVQKLDGRPGRSDVWKRGCFAWEYKGELKNLVRAYSQLKEYADALENPPLLIVSDMKEIRIHTNFTSSVAQTIIIKILDLNDPTARERLRWAFTNPERLRPTATRELVTADAAKALGELARRLQKRRFDERRVAHFLNKLVFSMFVEDVELLPDRVFADVVEESLKHEADFEPMLRDLFAAMRHTDGRFGRTRIPWFNGGLFDDDDIIPLGHFDILRLAHASRLDWGAIEPSIFGTLFERGLDQKRRKEMAGLFEGEEAEPYDEDDKDLFSGDAPDRAVGIYYTDPAKIMRIVEPVVLRPLRREWELVKSELANLHGPARERRFLEFRERLSRFRVLDPACGSGNFLYLALMHLKDLDLAVAREAVKLDLPVDGQRIGPDSVLGIEINPYAAELARVTVWIGELQWQIRNNFAVKRRPILGALKGIVCRDALLNPDDTEAKWPGADVIIGNPPFLGNKDMIGTLGERYTRALRQTFAGRVPGGADLVCHWFEKARAMIAADTASRVGLVATQAIWRGASRTVLDRIRESAVIFDAWSDEPWIIDGAAVRVSLVCFAPSEIAGHASPRLDGHGVRAIFSDLTAGGVDLTKAKRLIENAGVCFQGPVKVGPFDISGELARRWLRLPSNPNGRPNSDVVRPWLNGSGITDRNPDKWIVDFGEMSEASAALYEAPFEYVRQHVKPMRDKNRRQRRRTAWWHHGETVPGLRAKLSALSRFIATPRVAKHRLFTWVSAFVLPDSRVNAVARDDDTSFGILHSRFHEAWSLALGGWHGVGNDPQYTPTATFETFPFPEGLSPNIAATSYASDPRAVSIAETARTLNELRDAWLNPAEQMKRTPEVVAGYPDRVVPVGASAAAKLKTRTLTKLYNERPTWLTNAHRDLNAAVAAAYGWPADISDDDALARLFELNQDRAARGAA